ncbi:hypothetical protein B0H34DRAFT_724517 [Crassisporium funariophilum]|nr:hypothetical protein B0H34DRAFT_724517 [Crassisporium funariophilum]
MGRYNDLMEELVCPPPSTSGLEATPVCRQCAVVQAQTLEEDLSNSKMVALVKVFQKDVSAADIYNVLSRESLRKAWVCDTINGTSSVLDF